MIHEPYAECAELYMFLIWPITMTLRNYGALFTNHAPSFTIFDISQLLGLVYTGRGEFLVEFLYPWKRSLEKTKDKQSRRNCITGGFLLNRLKTINKHLNHFHNRE